MKIQYIILFLLFVNSAIAQNCPLNDTAKYHWHRARAAEDIAQTPADYKNAIDEYTKAFEHAPECPDIAYDLGLCYEYCGTTDTSLWRKAVEYYRIYLKLKPQASNKELVIGKIYKMEYIIENNELKTINNKVK